MNPVLIDVLEQVLGVRPGRVLGLGYCYLTLHSCGGSFGGSPIRQEIGLGAATAIRLVEVRWPVSGTVTVLRDVPMDGMIRVTEGVPGFDSVRLPRADL